jgi:alpha-tubulin suppressor-like RCC1 family protein
VIDGSTSYATAIAGNQTTCGITTTGVLKCWGNNSNGQIGDYTTTNKLLPTIIDFGTLYSLVSPGNLFTCGITTGGVAKCWGDNSSGQLGDGTTTERHRPNYVNDSDTYSTVSTGKGHSTCGVTSAGTLKCWGQNTQGQLGDSTTTGRKAPTTINPPNTLYASVAEGSDYACAITTSGALNCWGNYDHSQINSSSSPVAVDASNPYNYITGGGSHICGITQAGIYTCWGLNTYGQLGDSTNQDSNSPISLNL